MKQRTMASVTTRRRAGGGKGRTRPPRLLVLLLLLGGVAALASAASSVGRADGDPREGVGHGREQRRQLDRRLHEPADGPGARDLRPADLGRGRHATRPARPRTPPSPLKNGVAVYGGFPAAGGDWASRDPGANVTTLNGGGNGTGDVAASYHVVTAPAGTDATAVLDGFTVRGANTYVTTNTKGGGLLVYGSPTLTDLVIKTNYSCLCGAGMYIQAAARHSPTSPSRTMSRRGMARPWRSATAAPR